MIVSKLILSFAVQPPVQGERVKNLKMTEQSSGRTDETVRQRSFVFCA